MPICQKTGEFLLKKQKIRLSEAKAVLTATVKATPTPIYNIIISYNVRFVKILKET